MMCGYMSYLFKRLKIWRSCVEKFSGLNENDWLRLCRYDMETFFFYRDAPQGTKTTYIPHVTHQARRDDDDDDDHNDDHAQ